MSIGLGRLFAGISWRRWNRNVDLALAGDGEMLLCDLEMMFAPFYSSILEPLW